LHYQAFASKLLCTASKVVVIPPALTEEGSESPDIRRTTRDLLLIFCGDELALKGVL